MLDDQFLLLEGLTHKGGHLGVSYRLLEDHFLVGSFFIVRGASFLLSFVLTFEDGVELLHVLSLKCNSSYLDSSVTSWDRSGLRAGSIILGVFGLILHF